MQTARAQHPCVKVAGENAMEIDAASIDENNDKKMELCETEERKPAVMAEDKRSFKDLRRHSTPTGSGPSTANAPSFISDPTPEQERDYILHALAERSRNGATAFIISMGWWNAWRAYVGLDATVPSPSSADSTEQSSSLKTHPRPGPLNNMGLRATDECPTLMELCALRVMAMHKKGQIDLALPGEAHSTCEEAAKKKEEKSSPSADEQTRPREGGDETQALLNQDVLDYLAQFHKSTLRRALCRARELRAGLVEGHNCVAVSLEAWRALWYWYGGGPVIPRPVIPVGVRQRVQVELYPVTLLVLPFNSGRAADMETHRFTFSPHDQLKTIRRSICGRFLHPPHKVELYWHFDPVAAQQGHRSEASHLVDLDQTLEEAGLHDGCLLSLRRAAHDLLGLGVAIPPPAQAAPQQTQPARDPVDPPESSPAQPL